MARARQLRSAVVAGHRSAAGAIVHPVRRRSKFLVTAAVVAVLAPIAALIGANVFLNVWLPVLLNRQPERLKMSWDWAWTWNLRRVEVWGYGLRVQGPLDQWWLAVDHAELVVELAPLWERRFQADDLDARADGDRRRDGRGAR